jgi:diguanylate cyclase (GGDEF)-like protein/PAS domain S-box-containing protein
VNDKPGIPKWHDRFGWFNRLSLRAELLGGFLIAVGLIAVVGVAALWSQEPSQAAFNQLIDVDGRIAELSARASAAMHEARRAEKDFLLYRTEFGFTEAKARYVTRVRTGLAELGEYMVAIRELTADPEKVEGTQSVELLVRRYQDGFFEVVDLFGALGFVDIGLEGRLRRGAHQIEATLIARGLSDKLMLDLLTLRRHEKDFITRGLDKYSKSFFQSTTRFKAEITASGLSPSLEKELRALVDEYAAAFGEYVSVQNQINSLRAVYLAAAHAVEPLLEKLYVSTAVDVAATRERVQVVAQVTAWTVVISSLGALLIGLGVALVVSRRITGAVAECLAFATRVAAGDLNARIAPRDQSEFGTLAVALNQMTQGLQESRASLEARADELTVSNRALQTEIAVRQQTDSELRRFGRARKVMSDCNHVLVHATSESKMLDDMCRIIVEVGGYRMAWVGYAEHDEYKTVRPVAQFGFEGGLEAMPSLLGRISWADTELGRGAVGTAIRTAAPCVKRDFLANADLAPWREEAMRRGYVSVVTFPLYVEGGTIGALAIYSSEADAFNEAEIELLSELATDVGFGIESVRTTAARRMAEEALQESEAGLRRAQQMTKTGHVLSRADGSFESWSETMEQILGVDAASMPPTTRAWLEIVHPDDRAMFRERSIDAAKRHVRTDLEYRLKRTDGAWVELRQVMEPLESQSAPDQETRWFNSIQDVTGQKQAERKIERLNRVYAVLSGINTLIVRVRDRGELFREVCRIAVEAGQFGFAWIGVFDPPSSTLSTAAYHGVERDDIAGLRVPIAPDMPAGQSTAVDAIRSKRAVACRDMKEESDKGVMRAEALALGLRSNITLPLLLDDAVAGVMVLYSREVGFFDEQEIRLLDELAGDIAFALDHLGKAEALDYLAYYDALTGLANRNLMQDRLHYAIANATRSGDMVTVAFLDLDHFKHVNDSLGHTVGDELLKEVARRLKSSVRESDTVARMGGDEFVVLLPSQERTTSVAGGTRGIADATPLEARVTELMRRLIANISRPMLLAERDVSITCSVGLSVCPQDGSDTETLLRNADAAMYRAKELGRNNFQFFTADMHERVQKRMELESGLKLALERDEFELHYQPQVDLRSGKMVGMEALLRWRHPQQGLVGPGQFIGLAEDSGLIIPIGEWVLARACAQNKAWQDQGLASLPVAVNLSARQCAQKNIDTVVRDVLQATGLPPQYLELELTESISMANPEQMVPFMQRLKELGVELSIDDFGTGYSSMSYLKRFPVDKLKLDLSFVREITTDPNNLAISEAIITLAHSLDLLVIAEGVETEGQLALLAARDCDQMQGYFFSRPLPADALAQLLREDRRLAPDLIGQSKEAPAVLVLDDDPDAIALLERALQREGYRLLPASNVSDALEMLARHEVGVVLCDQRMPGMSGVEFLSKVRSMYPRTTRVLMSAHEDFEAARDAINRGAVYKFLGKSWGHGELKAVLEEAFQAYRRNAAARPSASN